MQVEDCKVGLRGILVTNLLQPNVHNLMVAHIVFRIFGKRHYNMTRRDSITAFYFIHHFVGCFRWTWCLAGSGCWEMAAISKRRQECLSYFWVVLFICSFLLTHSTFGWMSISPSPSRCTLIEIHQYIYIYIQYIFFFADQKNPGVLFPKYPDSAPTL